MTSQYGIKGSISTMGFVFQIHVAIGTYEHQPHVARIINRCGKITVSRLFYYREIVGFPRLVCPRVITWVFEGISILSEKYETRWHSCLWIRTLFGSWKFHGMRHYLRHRHREATRGLSCWWYCHQQQSVRFTDAQWSPGLTWEPRKPVGLYSLHCVHATS